jgi:polyhydroxyalkanoate synthase
MSLMPTPRDAVFADGTAQLLHFRRPEGVSATDGSAPVLLVPSMINRWYVLDLRKGSSVVESFVAAGLDTWCIDWGLPNEEDRYLTWKDCVDRLARMLRRVLRETGKKKASVMGYCMGATLASVHAALEPETYAGFVNLLGPIDFSHAGMLGTMVDERWFDGGAIADAGNVAPRQMQSGFTLLRPTSQFGKWVGFIDRCHEPAFRLSFKTLETWSNDNVAFPAEAYRTYISEMYQKNLLFKGEHAVGGKRARLKNITCPVMTVAAERDAICPPPAAVALNQAVGSKSARVLQVPGGHVGAVVGSKASHSLYPALIEFMRERTCA